MTFYRFTCEHSAEKIDASGVVIPHPQPMLGDVYLSWFSTIGSASPASLGLAGQTIIRCDRTECVYEVVEEDEPLIVRWDEFKRLDGFAPLRDPATFLEAARGTRPAFWAVAAQPVRVTRLR